MFKNLFSKLLSSYLVIILITLLAVGIAMSQLFSNYYYNVKEQELTRKGQEISQLISAFMNNQEDPKSIRLLLDTLDPFLDARMFVVDRDGLVLADSVGMAGPRHLQLETWETERVLKGEVVSKRGINPRFNQAMLSVAVPIISSNKVAGAILLFTPVAEITATIHTVRVMILYAAGAAVLLSTLLGYLLSRSISKPLRQMSAVTMAMSRSNFQERVSVTSQDEVGQLAENFNHMAVSLGETVEALALEKGKMENILTNMVEGVLAVDSSGQILLANAAVENTFHLNDRNNVSLFESDLAKCPGLSKLFQEVIQAGEKRSLELALDEGKTFMLAHVSPLREKDGDNYGAVGVFQDITELRQLEQLRRDFVANVSHELRTPLTSIRGFVEAMLDGMIKEKNTQDHYLRVIHQESLRLNRLINDLLDLSLIESGKIKWEFKAIDVPALMARIILKLNPQAETRQLKIKLQLPSDLPMLWGNEDRVEQVLTNLVVNAIQFSPPEGLINVGANFDGNVITLSVQDTGPGIPSEDLPHIWERFHRVEKSRARTLGGTGLGLSIVRQIVEAHGGKVAVESKPGKGSTFYVSFQANSLKKCY